MVITTKLDIDLQRPLYPSVINAVQGDQNTRQLEISLYSGGVAFELPEGTTAAIRYAKPDGAKGSYSELSDGSPAFSISGNTVLFLLPPKILAVAGCVSAQIVLTHGDNILSTFGMQIHVEEDPSVGYIPSPDEGETQIDNSLIIVNGVLSVNTVNEPIKDETRPITSGAVYDEFSKAVALLRTI